MENPPSRFPPYEKYLKYLDSVENDLPEIREPSVIYSLMDFIIDAKACSNYYLENSEFKYSQLRQKALELKLDVSKFPDSIDGLFK